MVKFSQALLTVIGIIAIAAFAGENLASLYIRRGRLLLGLGVGSIAAAACCLLALQQPTVKALGLAKLIPLVPWILLFVLSNAVMEELLFRGLFLGRYEPLMGKGLAVLSTSLAFTLAHMQVKYTPDIAVFLLATFLLSLAWGWLMQKTESLWGSALFHAGADVLIILPIFRSMGAA